VCNRAFWEAAGYLVEGGTAMASRLLSDELWSEIERFFLVRQQFPRGGPLEDNRIVLTAVRT
jgi:hypothetical protein